MSRHQRTSTSVSQETSPLTKPDIKILYEPTDEEEADVDVVAVHGIGADGDTTWESKDSGVNWLRDLLPNTTPRARVLRFSWTSKWLGQDNIEQNCSAVAYQLLVSLRTARQDDPLRPIVFVAHCFGGIIVESAIITAKLHREDWVLPSSSRSRPSLVDCVAGFIFLGTPFKGTHATDYATAIAKLLSPVNRANSEIFELLKPKSRAMRDLYNHFVHIVVTKQACPVSCFYEMKKSNIARHVHMRMNREVMIVEESSATIDGVAMLGLESDHYHLHKFSSANDPKYERVLAQLRPMIMDAPTRIRARLNPQSMVNSEEAHSESHKHALSALCRQNPFNDRIKYQKKVDENDWRYYPSLFADRSYTSWLTDDSAKLLWIHGDDGLGKTPFTIALIDELTNRVERSSKKRVLAYCFCAKDNEERNSAIAIVRCLLYEVLCQRPEGFQPWLDQYHESAMIFAGKAPPTLSDLWSILQQTLISADIEVAYFLLYLPEECGPSITDGYPPLFGTRIEGKCCIKWIVISKMSPGSNFPSRQIDLALAPPTQTPIINSSPQSHASAGAFSPWNSSSITGAVSSGSSAPGLSLPPAREPAKVIKLVTVKCTYFREPWFCTIIVYPLPSPDAYFIECKRFDNSAQMGHRIQQSELTRLHTETSSSSDRRYTAYFLQEHDVTISTHDESRTVQDRPFYQFQDDSDLYTFHNILSDSTLLLIRPTRSIHSSRQGELSVKQDVQLWEPTDGETSIKLLFFANSIEKSARDYYEYPASSFVEPSNRNIEATALQLTFKLDPSQLSARPKKSMDRILRKKSHESKPDWLRITFESARHCNDFLEKWHQGIHATVPEPQAPKDVLFAQKRG